MLIRPAITDDAGKPVPLVRFNFTHLPMSLGPLPSRVQGEMVRAAERVVPALDEAKKSRGVGILMGVMPVLIVNTPMLVSFVSGMPWRGPWVWTLTAATIPVAVLAMFTAGPFAFTPVQRKAAARAAVREGYCGSCGYQIADLRGGAGVVRCPECGAAWEQGERSDGVVEAAATQ